MKKLVRKLIFAKLGAGLVTSIMAYRKKSMAVVEIEQSEFYNLIQRICHHPRTKRRDGFFNTTYQFSDSIGKDTSIEAIVQKQRPADVISVNDSLEIAIQSNERTIHIKQVVKSKPLTDKVKLPTLFNKGLLGMLYVEEIGSAADTGKAFETLNRTLGVAGESIVFLEAEKT